MDNELVRVFQAPAERVDLYSVMIAVYRESARLIRFPYGMGGDGERYAQAPVAFGKALTSRGMRMHQRRVWNSARERWAKMRRSSAPR